MSEPTLENILANPAAFGLPTFHEFAKDPDAYSDSKNDRLGRVDRSSVIFKNLIEKQVYKIAGFEVKTLEEVDRIAREENIDLLQCKLVPEVAPTVAGKCNVVLEFKPKSQIVDNEGNNYSRAI